MNMNLEVCDEVTEIAHRSHYLTRPLISEMQQSRCTLLMKIYLGVKEADMIVQGGQGLRVQVYPQGGSTGCPICALITVLGLRFRECSSLVTLNGCRIGLGTCMTRIL